MEGHRAVCAMSLRDGNRAVHATSGEEVARRTENHNFGAAVMRGAFKFASRREFPVTRSAVVRARCELRSIRIEGDGGNCGVMFEFQNLAASVDVPNMGEFLAARCISQELAIRADGDINDPAQRY